MNATITPTIILRTVFILPSPRRLLTIMTAIPPTKIAKCFSIIKPPETYDNYE